MNISTLAFIAAALSPLSAADQVSAISKFAVRAEPITFTDQFGLLRDDYLCGYVRARVVVTRQSGVADTMRVYLEGLGKDHDPWLAWGECKVQILDKSNRVISDLKDDSKPSKNPHWLVNRTEKENLTYSYSKTESGLYDIVGGIRLTVLGGWHNHR